MIEHYDIGVIGYGPCAVVLVNLLLEQGLSVVVFEKDAGVTQIPRAAHFDDETLRTFQALGAAEELSTSFTSSKDYTIYNALDQRVWGFSQFEPKPTDQGWLSDYWFSQPEFETHLRQKASDRGVQARLACEVLNLDEQPDGVLITYKESGSTNGGHSSQCSARYVVGADGARSFVRRHLGLQMESLAERQRWMIVDIRMHEGVEGDLETDCWTRVNADETVTFVPMPNNVKRFEFSMDEKLDEAAVKSPEAVEQFISRWFKPGDYTVLRADVYQFHSRVAHQWRKGRIFIAGDAAHTAPPFLGQGVCTAIRDSMNLAWKLARVVKGISSDNLLDTYESERRPHAYTFVKVAGDVGNSLLWMARASKEELAAMEQHDYVQMRPPLGPGVYADPAKAGSVLAPQPRLADGRLLDDKVGYRFALVGDPILISNLSVETTDQLKSLDVVVVSDDSETVKAALAPLQAGVILVRPDRYLVGAAASVVEVGAMVSELTRSLH